MLPHVPNTLKNETVVKIYDVSLEKSQKNYEMQARLVSVMTSAEQVRVDRAQTP